MTIERVCVGPFARWMNRRGWLGVTLPLPFVVVVLYWLEPSERTRRHELVHVEQVRRYGWLGFLARYAWGLRRGYAANPLEIEAREKS